MHSDTNGRKVKPTTTVKPVFILIPEYIVFSIYMIYNSTTVTGDMFTLSTLS